MLFPCWQVKADARGRGTTGRARDILTGSQPSSHTRQHHPSNQRPDGFPPSGGQGMTAAHLAPRWPWEVECP